MQSLCETQTLLDSTCFGIFYKELDTASYPSLDSQARGPPHPQVPPNHVAVSPSLSLAPQRSATADTAPSRCPNSNSPLAGQRVTKHCDNATSSSSSTITSSTDLADSIPSDRLRKEVFGNTLNTNTLNTSSNFLKQLLPPERLPFPVNEDFLRKLSAPIGPNAPIWNGLRNCFRQSPTNFGQATICAWLNSIGTAMGLVYGRQCERLWWGNFEVPRGGPSESIQRKDLILLDRSHYYRILQQPIPDTRWAFVKALVDVHQSPNARLTYSVSTATYLTFLHQPHRRFTISLSFINVGNGQFSITVTDRAGQIRVNNIDLMGSSTENGLLLLSVLAFLMFGRPEDIGLDPHFEINPFDGQAVAINCENRRFEVVKRIHALRSLFGRGTQVWIVVHSGVEYILKDSWVREDRIHNEVTALRRMKGHKGLEGCVPTLICGGDIIINGVEDSIRRYRSHGARCTHRIHRRIVTSPVGKPITSFKSKKEFIQAMISIIESKLIYSSDQNKPTLSTVHSPPLPILSCRDFALRPQHQQCFTQQGE